MVGSHFLSVLSYLARIQIGDPFLRKGVRLDIAFPPLKCKRICTEYYRSSYHHIHIHIIMCIMLYLFIFLYFVFVFSLLCILFYFILFNFLEKSSNLFFVRSCQIFLRCVARTAVCFDLF